MAAFLRSVMSSSGFGGDSSRSLQATATSDATTTPPPLFRYTGGMADENHVEAKQSPRILIGANVTTIPAGAFQGCTALEHVEFETNSQVKTIELNAFEMTKISKIEIPNSVIEIGEYAFSKCKLRHVTLDLANSKLEKIAQGAFAESSLSTMDIPSSVTEIGEAAFNACIKLITVKMDLKKSQLRKIGNAAFHRTSLAAFYIPASVEEIGDYAFGKCERLSDVKIVKNGKLKKIGHHAFARTHITAFAVPSTVEEIGGGAFMSCKKLANVKIDAKKSQLQKFDIAVFFESSLTSIEIPSKVQEIGEFAFGKCKRLTSVKMTNDGNLQKIGNSAFAESSLPSIEIPDSVEEIGDTAFADCKRLVDVKVDVSNSKLTKIGANMFEGTSISSLHPIYDCPLTPEQRSERMDNFPVHKWLYEPTITTIIIQSNDDTTNEKSNDDDNENNDNEIVTITADAQLRELEKLWETNPKAFEAANNAGMTVLHVFASLPPNQFNVEILEFLIKKLPKIFLVTKDQKGRCPIHYACMTGVSDPKVLWLLSTNLAAFYADVDGASPLTLGIRHGNLSLQAAVLLYSFHPISNSMVSGKEELGRLHKIKKEYVAGIKKGSILGGDNSKKKKDSTRQQHGWVCFMYSHLENDDPLTNELYEFLKNPDECSSDLLTSLSKAKDSSGREAMKVAPPLLKKAFVGRFGGVVGESPSKTPPKARSDSVEPITQPVVANGDKATANGGGTKKEETNGSKNDVTETIQHESTQTPDDNDSKRAMNGAVKDTSATKQEKQTKKQDDKIEINRKVTEILPLLTQIKNNGFDRETIKKVLPLLSSLQSELERHVECEAVVVQV